MTFSKQSTPGGHLRAIRISIQINNIKRDKLVIIITFYLIITFHLFLVDTNIKHISVIEIYNMASTEQQQPIDDFVSGLVSVIIPSYNRYVLLNHSIRSVLANTYKNVEVIVINDCSTDQRYYSGELEKYEKTTVIHLPENMRVKHKVPAAQGMTRNYGIEKARGEWIAFLDDDDFYLDYKIEKQLEVMKNENILFSTTNMYMINHHSVSMDKLDINTLTLHNSNEQENKIFNLKMITEHNHIANSTVIIHHSIVKKTGAQRIVRGAEDWDYWKRALQYTDCLYISEPLVYYTWTIQDSMNTRYY